MLFGLTRGTTAADLGRAVLEGVAYQVADLIAAAVQDGGRPLRGAGGRRHGAERGFLQCQADVLGLPVVQTPDSEATARGAAFLAGWKARLWPDLELRLAAWPRTPGRSRRFWQRTSGNDGWLDGGGRCGR